MKIIGIVGRVYYNKDNQEIIQLNDAIRQVLASYNNIIPILLLPTSPNSYNSLNIATDTIPQEEQIKIDFLLEKCAGFIIPGGSSWYKFDEYILNHAKKNKKPTLAICAGFQCLCSMHAINRTKLDMTKKLANDNHYGSPKDYHHEIIISPHTQLNQILQENQISINSLHHDCIDFPLQDLIVSARSIDGVIEAVELQNHPFLIGVQWHPEYLKDKNSKKIFDSFIKALNK